MAARNDGSMGARMHGEAPRFGAPPEKSSLDRALFIALSVVVALVSVSPRFVDLGLRSLWLDEFSTWHVSTLPLLESLRWPPEITIPPLYQLCVRSLDVGNEYPSEWLLRLPAAIAGVLFVPVIAWFGFRCGGRWIGLTVAALAALHPLSIEYSREARPYSILVLFCTLASGLWLELLRRPRACLMIGYVVAMSLGLYSHVLAVPVLAAHSALLLMPGVCSHRIVAARCRLAVVACLVAVVPLAIRVLFSSSALKEALGWNPSLTPATAWSILGSAGFGPIWSVLLIVTLGSAVWCVSRGPRAAAPASSRFAPKILRRAEHRAWSLLCLWVFFGGGALIAAAIMGMPLVAQRYLLVATPAILLLPLLELRRLHSFASPAVALLFIAMGLPASVGPPPIDPGLRELMRLIHAERTPGERVFMAVSAKNDEFRLLESLGAVYYNKTYPVWAEALPIADESAVLKQLSCEQRVRIIVLLGDPLPLIKKSGRKIEAIPFGGTLVTQLLFPPYRLITLAPTADVRAWQP